MKEEDKIIAKYGKKGPWRVPEGYFEAVYEQIEVNLPEYPEKPQMVQLSKWQRVKPYLYLAAMFMGIWLMMQVFHRVSGGDTLSLDNPPQQIAAYMGDASMEDMYVVPSSLSDEELIDEVSENYNSMAEFEADFSRADADEAAYSDNTDFDDEY